MLVFGNLLVQMSKIESRRPDVTQLTHQPIRRKKIRANQGFLRNPPLPGKKFFLVSLVSPDNEQQKSDVHAFKIHDVCETREEADRLGAKYRNMDPRFNVYVQEVGVWLPWVTDPLHAEDVQYVDKKLNALLQETAKEADSVKKGFGKGIKDVMDERTDGKNIQKNLSSKNEPAVSVYFKQRQLEEVIKQRKLELENLTNIFHSRYSRAERQEAKKADLPLSKPTPMHFSSMAGLEEDEDSSDEDWEEDEMTEEEQKKYDEYLATLNNK